MAQQQRPQSALEGKVAVVTGGSSGIGAACARLLAAQGASVVVGYNQGEARAREVMESLAGNGHSLARLPLTELPALEEAAARLRAGHECIDVLVNSAGFTRRIAHKNLDALDPALFNEILAANTGGTYAVTRALLPLLQASGDAVVINVSSISAFTGSGSNIAYCASKAAMDTMTMSFARAFGPVRFLCVSPASVDTDFVPGRDRADLEKRAAGTPLGRIVTPEDVAQAVLGCVTHMRTATGTRFVIDGGYQL